MENHKSSLTPYFKQVLQFVLLNIQKNEGKPARLLKYIAIEGVQFYLEMHEILWHGNFLANLNFYYATLSSL